MHARIVTGLVVGMLGVFGTAGLAQDGATSPTGTWKWTTERNGQKRETTLKLKADGGKLTGTITGGKDTEVKIEDGTVKDGEVKFTVTREFKDQKITSKYSAKVSGDAMKGTIESSFGGKDNKREFEAKRDK